MALVGTIIADAMTEIGVLEAGEALTSEQAALGLRRVQHMIDSWAADRLTLAAQLRTTFTLASGDSSVTLGPSGADVTMGRPVYLNGVSYLIPGSSPSVEVPIGLMNEDAYAALSIKELPSALPLQAFYQTSVTTALGTLFIWPQVTQAVTIVLYTPQAITVPTTLNTDLIGPPGYQDGFMYSLALRLCTPMGVAVPPLLPDLATRAMATMKRPNVQPGILGIDAALVPNSGGGFNVLSGTTSAWGGN